MILKREEKVSHGGLGKVLIPLIPQKKQFSTMLEMLRDAEKYDNEGEKDVSDAMLTNLCEFIERYKDTHT